MIHDDSVTGQLNSLEFRRASADFENQAKFSYLAGLRLEELASKVKQLQPDSVIVYFASFVEDATGESISSGDALKIVSDSSPVPVYGGWEFTLGKGMVGGRLVNLREHGAMAATIALRVLRGEAAETLPKVSPSPNQYMFDYAQMSRFGIAKSQLPAGSIVINEPPSFLWTYRVEILGALSAVLLVAMTVIFVQLVKSRRSLKIERDKLVRQNSDLEDALSKVKQLEGIIPICMYCKKIANDEASWQQMEIYITEHSEAQFSHGFCPDCFEIFKGEVATKKQSIPGKDEG